ncbi:hypothetical protein L1987_37767 [Smallanthus sonchifolius]|uniref:Uncharacterized protein n=1 Tax=Smallanthus sonchifolius TaxID=185202 RepID=A0ACB9HHN8_9ASTR|nr:hypothetical protein L1987_37767 [Smallanthus sonchifolius]
MMPEQQPPPPALPSKPIREFVVAITNACGMLLKDGLGTSSSYVVANFDQKKRTSMISGARRVVEIGGSERVRVLALPSLIGEGEEGDYLRD